MDSPERVTFPGVVRKLGELAAALEELHPKISWMQGSLAELISEPDDPTFVPIALAIKRDHSDAVVELLSTHLDAAKEIRDDLRTLSLGGDQVEWGDEL
jgi:hypothetical protein